MKKAFYIIVALSCLGQLIFAQEGMLSTGKIPNMKIERTHTVVNQLANQTNIAYGYSNLQNVTLSMPIPAGTPFNYLSGFYTSNFASSMCKGCNDYYLIDISRNLYSFNETTGDINYLGSITGMSGDQPNGIAFNPADKKFYMVSSSNFYSLDIETRVATLIGTLNLTSGGLMIDLCFDLSGTCYAYEVNVSTASAYTINISTGNATAIGMLGYNPNYGQGMSYDYETQTIYLSAFNGGTNTGQLRTMDPATGMTTLITDWGYEQIAPFEIANSNMIICPCWIGEPSNPNPPSGSTDINIAGTTLNWMNGVYTTLVELWFGEAGYLNKVYDGTAITSWATPSLNYQTTYQWKVVCKNDTCGTQGSTWSFTTMQDPNQTEWCDDFNDLNSWTIVGPLGLTNWSAAGSSSAGGTPPELRMSWTPSFNGESKIRSIAIPLQNNYTVFYQFNFYFDWYADPSGTVTVGITYDGGATSSTIYSLVDPTGNVGPTLISGQFYTPSSGSQNAQIEITFSGNSFNNDNIYWDDLCLWPGFPVYPPNPPSNLTAQVIFNPNPQVQLNWQDNSGNESGFRIYRKFGYPNDPNDYLLVGTTQNNITQFIDATVLSESTYTYRVFAYNPYGENGSNTTTIAVPVPVELISFTADVDGNVVTLFWQTATETNNQGFEIERQVGNKQSAVGNWNKVGFVEGKGTTTEIQSYLFTDKPEPGIPALPAGRYKYRLKQIDFDGTFAYSPEVEAEVEVKAPNAFSLEQNYPNPFNPSTKIKYTIPNVIANEVKQSQLITFKVYDILGNEVATLVNEEQAPGVYEVEFNSSSHSGEVRNLPSGIYFYQLKAGQFVETKKMVLMK